MKLKAVVSRNLPPELLEALNSSEVADTFRDIVVEYLNVRPSDFGPATHYVQETDMVVPMSNGQTGIEIMLSKVSLSPRRSAQSFRDTLEAFKKFYIALIQRHLPEGEKTQLFCVLALDGPVKFPGEEPTSLVELPAVMVDGLKLKVPVDPQEG